MLKQKFSRGSSKEPEYDSKSLPRKSKHGNATFYDDKNGGGRLAPTASGNVNATSATSSANVTPEMIRRAYAPDLRNEAALRYELNTRYYLFLS